jgi:hypothetical protein
MKQAILLKSVFFACLFCFSIKDSFSEEQSSLVLESDSVTSKLERGLLSLIDTAFTSKVTAREISQSIDYKDAATSNQDSAIYTIYQAYNRLILPLNFSRPYFSDVWVIAQKPSIFDNQLKIPRLYVDLNQELSTYFAIDSIRKEIVHNIIFQHPEWVKSLQESLPEDFVLKEVAAARRDSRDVWQSVYKPDLELNRAISARRFSYRFKEYGHWITANKSAVQFSQNYISTNWQQGGESNLSMLGLLNMKANYIHPKGWSWYNELEWRASFYTAPSDTVRSWRVNDDVFRISSILSIKAVQKWNYSVSTEFKTRFFNSFNANSNKKSSSFLSPADFSFGLGMSYENEFPKLNINGLGLVVSPFSYNLKYVMDKNVDETRFGITKEESFLRQYGSRLDLRITYNMKKNIIWNSRFYYFTTYESVESEWENTINFVINRYFSTRLFFHLKYDDKRTLRVGENSYFQFKELLSFGLNYTW